MYGFCYDYMVEVVDGQTLIAAYIAVAQGSLVVLPATRALDPNAAPAQSVNASNSAQGAPLSAAEEGQASVPADLEKPGSGISPGTRELAINGGICAQNGNRYSIIRSFEMRVLCQTPFLL